MIITWRTLFEGFKTFPTYMCATLTSDMITALVLLNSLSTIWTFFYSHFSKRSLVGFWFPVLAVVSFVRLLALETVPLATDVALETLTYLCLFHIEHILAIGTETCVIAFIGLHIPWNLNITHFVKLLLTQHTFNVKNIDTLRTFGAVQGLRWYIIHTFPNMWSKAKWTERISTIVKFIRLLN